MIIIAHASMHACMRVHLILLTYCSRRALKNGAITNEDQILIMDACMHACIRSASKPF